MVAQSTAGVEFVGNLMRYAEVEHDGTSNRLLRLGNCEFEFDASEVVYAGSLPQHIETIQSALKDVFKDTISSSFRFVVPSTSLTQFESLVPVDSDESAVKSQIGFETHLMNGGESGGDVFSTEESHNPNLLINGFLVQHLSQRISDRLAKVCEVFPDQERGHLPSTNASVRTYRKLVEKGAVPSGSALMIGCYPNRTDYITISDGVPIKTVSRDTPEEIDRAYFAQETLHRFPEAVFSPESVLVYGHTISADFISLLGLDFGKRVSIMNPGPLVDLEQDRFEDGFPIQAFVPCLGVSVS